MTKKIIQITLIIAAISIIVYVYFNISSDKENIGDPFLLITPRTSIVMEITDMSGLDDFQPILQAISQSSNEVGGVSFNPTSEWHSIILKIDSLRANSDLWFKTLSKSPLVMSSNEQGRGDAWQVLIGLGNLSSSEISSMMELWQTQESKRDFKNQEIHECADMQWVVLNQCLVIASISSMLEDAVIHASNKQSNHETQLLNNVRQISSRDIPVHYYIAESKTAWLQLDPIWIGGQAVLSGYRMTSDESTNSLSLASNGHSTGIQNVLPVNTSYVDCYSYNDFESGWRMHEEYFAGSEKSRFWSQAWQDLGDSCQCDLNASMVNWRSGEWGTAVITLSDSSTAEVAYFGIKDTTDIIPLLQPALDHSPDKASGIYKIKYPQLFERNQPEGILIEHNYVMQHNGYVFAATTPGDLRAIINSGVHLSDDACFSLISIPLNKSTGRFVFRKDFYAAPVPQILRQMLAGFTCVAMESESAENNRILLTLSLPVQRPEINSASTEQNSSPNTVAAAKDIVQGPWTVTNHKTGGKEEAIVNKAFELCLIGENGDFLWKKSIGSRVLGNVVQIDALNNGKLQLAFTTESAIHIVDRNGNDLKGFPYKNKESISSPLLVADYENNKKYRLIFASSDGSIVNLNTTGTVTEGWKNPVENAVINQVTHFKTGNEDLLMAVSVTGKISLYKRNGELKQKTEMVLEGYDGGPIQIQSGQKLSDCKITFTNKNSEKKTLQLTD